MEGTLQLTYEEYINGLQSMFVEDTGQLAPSDLSTSGCSVVMSYAPPDVVRQAKLEAMDIKVRRKMLEHKASLHDPHALSDRRAQEMRAAPPVKVSALTAGVGSRDLVMSLVVPPEITAKGEEVRGSSQLILAGQQREYQRPARGAAQGRDPATAPMPRYRTRDPNESDVEQEASDGGAGAGKRGLAAGAANSGAGAAASAPGGWKSSSGGGRVGAGGNGSWAGQERPRVAKAELAVQLSDGMLTYVPSRFERPQGVESTAFVPQTQAMMEARSTYNSVRQRRPSSAPPRRSISMATSVASEAPEIVRESSTATSAVAAGWTGAGGAGTGADRGRGDADASAGASRQQDKWRTVTMVRVEEEDLLAMYRQNSQHLLAPPAPTPEPPLQQQPRSNSPVRATIQSTNNSTNNTPRVRPTSASRSVTFHDGSANAASHRAAAAKQATAPASGRQPVPDPRVTTHSASTADGHHRPGTAASSTWRSSPNKGASSNPSSPLRRNSAASPARTAGGFGPPPKDAWAAKPPSPAPAATSASPTRPWSAKTASATSTSRVWKNPRPPSPSRTPNKAPSRGPSQRRVSATSSGPTGANNATAGTSRSSDAPAAASSAAGGGTGSRSGFQPVDPATRQLLQQKQNGGVIHTAKTNRLRTQPARSGATGGTAGGGVAAAVADSGGHQSQPAWTTSSSSSAGVEGRSSLQERILGGLARQYIAGPDDEPDDVAAPVGNPSGMPQPQGSGGFALQRGRSARVGSQGEGASWGGSGVIGSFLQAQRSTAGFSELSNQQPSQPHVYQHAPHLGSRPQSAPNRRVRPPSAGSWAGRPDRDMLARRSGQGNVYDPELQPSPLDSYMNQLVGLD